MAGIRSADSANYGNLPGIWTVRIILKDEGGRGEGKVLKHLTDRPVLARPCANGDREPRS